MARGSFATTMANLACGVLLVSAPAAMFLANAEVTTTARAAAEPERNKQIVVAALDRWAAGGSDFFNEILAPDIVWTIEGSGPGAGTYRGRDDFIAHAVRPLASRMSVAVRPVSKRVWADGEHVVINWQGEGVARDGQPYRNRYVWILRMAGGKATEVNAFLDLAVYGDVLRRIAAPDLASLPSALSNADGTVTKDERERAMSQQHPYVGMWVTSDGHIRQELRSNGRYDEARGSRHSAYQGRYEIKGNHIEYWDDTGFTADGTFVSRDELHHGGMIFKRQE
nr:Atu4866 domain-containing protein [Steroidobacter cummioxidans]